MHPADSNHAAPNTATNRTSASSSASTALLPHSSTRAARRVLPYQSFTSPPTPSAPGSTSPSSGSGSSTANSSPRFAPPLRLPPASAASASVPALSKQTPSISHASATLSPVRSASMSSHSHDDRARRGSNSRSSSHSTMLDPEDEEEGGAGGGGAGGLVDLSPDSDLTSTTVSWSERLRLPSLGRCLSHLWFLATCCGFLLLSSLPRLLTVADFVVTALIYSLSFAGQSKPSLSFWSFLRQDFEHYSFYQSGGSLLLLSFLRMMLLFWAFAYSFHQQRWAFVTATLTAAVSAAFVLVKWSLNENRALHALLGWSLAITLAEYIFWLAIRRQPVSVRHNTAADALPTHLASTMAVTSAAARPTAIGSAQAVRYQPLSGEAPEESVGGVGATRPASMEQTAMLSPARPILASSPHSPRSLPFHSPSFRAAPPGVGSFGAAGPSSLGASHSFSLTGSLGSLRSKMQLPAELELDPLSLADPDSLFLEIDSLRVHYKLVVNGRSVVPQPPVRRSGSLGSFVAPTTAPSLATSWTGREGESGSTPSSIPHLGSSSMTAGSSGSAVGAGVLEQSLASPASAMDESAAFLPSASTHASYSSTSASALPSPSRQFRSAIILLHSFGSSLFQWRALWGELGSRAPMLLAFDRPGFGLTSRPVRDSSGSFGTFADKNNKGGGIREQENPYTQEYNVSLLFRIMAALGVDAHQSLIIAHSSAAPIALRAAIVAPRLFSGVQLISPYIYTEGFPALIRSLLKTRLGKAITQQLVRSELAETTLKRAWFDPSHIPPEELDRAARLMRVRGQMEALTEMAATAADKNDSWSHLSERLHLLAGGNEPVPEVWYTARSASAASVPRPSVPVNIMHGVQDKLVDYSESVRAWKQMRQQGVDVQLVRIDHCGHVPHEEFPLLALKYIVRFVQECESHPHHTPRPDDEQAHTDDASTAAAGAQ